MPTENQPNPVNPGENPPANNPAPAGTNPNTPPTNPAPAWTEQLKGDLRGNEVLAKYSNISELGEALIEAQGKLSKAVTLPAEDASEEEMEAYRKAMGVPETADGYEFTLPTDLPEGYELSEERLDQYKGLFSKLNIPAKTANDLVAAVIAEEKAAFLQQQAERMQEVETSTTALKEAWQGKFDENLQLAKKAVQDFDGEEMVRLLDQTGLGNHPAIVQHYYKVGKSISDSGYKGGNVPPATEERGFGQLQFNK